MIFSTDQQISIGMRNHSSSDNVRQVKKEHSNISIDLYFLVRCQAFGIRKQSIENDDRSDETPA